MIKYVAKHGLYLPALAVTLALGSAAGIVPVYLATDPVSHRVSRPVAMVAAVAALAVIWAGVTLMERASRLAQIDFEARLSARYGVSVRLESRRSGVWFIDGEPRQATLTGTGALLVGGRELPRVAA